MKKIIILSILLVLSLTLVSCEENSDKETLETPVCIISNNIVSWNKITGATAYKVYVDNKLVDTISDTFYVLELEFGSYQISIKAIDTTNAMKDSSKSKTIIYTKNADKDSLELYKLLDDFSWEYDNMIDEAIEYVSEKQLKREFWWRDLEYTFFNHTDDDGGYRAEFWGKTLRGAVYTYQYNHDEELYDILETTIKNMLEFQKTEFEGRLSGFTVDNEFTGWDIRSHMYTLYGFYYFYQICKDEELKEEIVESLRLQVDYLVKRIGPNEGQVEILTTSPDWGGTTSANVLDGVIKAYLLVKDHTYLDFAKYIIDTGLSTMKSDEGKTLVESALDGDPMYEWGCRKLYEVNACFEGVLDYYLVTGDEYYLRLAMGFYKANAGIETTEIGSLAVDVEEACHSTVEQFNPYNLGRMNETCVQTTWIRFLLKMFMVTGNAEMMDYLEQAYYNFGFGSIDWEFHNDWPIFSYSPLATMPRDNVYSGTAFIGEDYHCQSCCVLSGISFMPVVVKSAILKSTNGFAVNMYIDGKINTYTPNGKAISFVCQTNYPSSGFVKNIINLEENESMNISFRIPRWSKVSTVKVNGSVVEGVTAGSYVSINREWSNGDTVELEFDMSTYLIYASKECTEKDAGYNVMVKRGPLVFARDSRLEGQNIFTHLSFDVDENGCLTTEIVDNSSIEHAQCELKVRLNDGTYVHLIDYGAAGKTMDENSIMSLNIPTFDYWSIDMTSTLVIKNDITKSPMKLAFSDRHMVEAAAYAYTSDEDILVNFAVEFELQSNGFYRIKLLATGGYLTVRADCRIGSQESLDDAAQLFNLKQSGMNRYKLELQDGRVLSLHDDGTVYATEDIKHPRQYWNLLEIEYDK